MPPSPTQVLILTALLIEARAIARAFSLPTSFSRSLASNGTLTVALVGPGASKLPLVAAAMQPQAVIMAGLAGALSPRLEIGDIVAEGVFTQGDWAPDGCRIHCEKLHTSAAIVATPAEKAALFLQTGAFAVDMETDHAKAFAAGRNVPFLALRAISDTAKDPLDPALLTLIDENGRPRLRHAAAYAAKRPWKVPELLRIQRASNRALSHLTATLVTLIASGWPADPTSRQQT